MIRVLLTLLTIFAPACSACLSPLMAADTAKPPEARLPLDPVDLLNSPTQRCFTLVDEGVRIYVDRTTPCPDSEYVREALKEVARDTELQHQVSFEGLSIFFTGRILDAEYLSACPCVGITYGNWVVVTVVTGDQKYDSETLKHELLHAALWETHLERRNGFHQVSPLWQRPPYN